MQSNKTQRIMLKTLRKKQPERGKIISVFCLAVLILYALVRIPWVAEYVFARGVTRGLSYVLSRITNPIPASFYEIVAAVLVVGGVVIFFSLFAFLLKKQFARALTWLYRLAVAALSVLLAFGVLYAPLYSRDGADRAMGLETAVTEQSVYAAAEYYVSALNETSTLLERDENGNVVPTCSFDELGALIDGSFSSLAANGYFAGYSVRPKAVLLSVPMSYLGITGIYFPFTAEANVNVNIPASELPVTVAHETAHAKGVSRENDANRTAYVLCILSSDAYLRYSGLMDAAAILLNSLPREQYEELAGRLNGEVLKEYANVRRHYEKYEGFIDSLSSFFNDLFLKANGVPSGTASYGETTECLVALYEKITDGEE